MLKVVIITADSFRDEEVIYPYIRLEEAGVEVHLASRGGRPPVSEYGFPTEKMYPTLMDTKNLRAEEYDAVILPGGLRAPDTVRSWEEVILFVKEMYMQGKVVAAICHGPWVLISAQVLKGKHATCHQNMAEDLKNAGAMYVDVPVVEDGSLITSRRPRDLGAFMKAILARLGVSV